MIAPLEMSLMAAIKINMNDIICDNIESVCNSIIGVVSHLSRVQPLMYFRFYERLTSTRYTYLANSFASDASSYKWKIENRNSINVYEPPVGATNAIMWAKTSTRKWETSLMASSSLILLDSPVPLWFRFEFSYTASFVNLLCRCLLLVLLLSPLLLLSLVLLIFFGCYCCWFGCSRVCFLAVSWLLAFCWWW